MRPRGDARALERRRIEAIKLFKEGIRPGRIAARLGVDRRSVHRWLAAYRSRGIEGIAPVPTLGRPSKISVDDRQKLSRILLGGATVHGYSTDRWTNPRIADVIRRRFGVTYHVNHIGRFLQRLNATVVPGRESDLRGVRKKELTVELALCTVRQSKGMISQRGKEV